MYQALLFDLDMTLMDFRQTEQAALTALFAQYHIPLTDTNLNAYRTANNACWRLVEQEQMTVAQLKQERIRRFLAAIGMPLALAPQMADDEIRYLGQGTYLMPYALHTIQALHTHYPIAIASNGIADVQRQRIWHGPLAPYIDQAYVSETVGFAKPNPHFFDPAIARYGRPLLLIGDSYQSDVLGAINARLDMLWVTTQAPPQPLPSNVRTIPSLKDLPALLLPQTQPQR